jgi:hypothetical protein
MAEDVNKKLQKAKGAFHHMRKQAAARVWNLAKRLDPRQMRKEKKK